MQRPWPAMVTHGGCDPERCTVGARHLDALPRWHGTVFEHDAGAGAREVAVLVYVATGELGVPGGLPRHEMDRLCDAWNAAIAAAFPAHHAEAGHAA